MCIKWAAAGKQNNHRKSTSYMMVLGFNPFLRKSKKDGNTIKQSIKRERGGPRGILSLLVGFLMVFVDFPRSFKACVKNN